MGGRMRCTLPSFLIDENRRIRPADTVAHGRDEVAQLCGLADIARKQDKAPRPLTAIEGDFIRRQFFPRRSEDHGF